MSPVNRYKNVESRYSSKLQLFLKGIYKSVSTAFKSFLKWGRQNFTIMLIPHSEKSVINFQVSVFSIVFSLCVVAGITIAGIASITGMVSMNTGYSRNIESLEKAEASLEMMREGISNIKKPFTNHKDTLNKVFSLFGISGGSNENIDTSKGDFTQFTSMEESSETAISEIDDIQQLQTYLETSVESISELESSLTSLKDLFEDIPSIWPVQGGLGTITSRHDIARHPLDGGLYIHKGLDIAHFRGTPILAAANGEVVHVDYDVNGYGLTVLVKHKYRFFTRYAHFSAVYVKNGDKVRRGQVIGAMGNTGKSTGTHLHYEVRINSESVDPEKFINISLDVE